LNVAAYSPSFGRGSILANLCLCSFSHRHSGEVVAEIAATIIIEERRAIAAEFIINETTFPLIAIFNKLLF
jgi:hypothetical protein